MSMLLMVGAVVVYAIGPGLTSGESLPENYYSSKQLTAIVLGIVGFVIASAIPIESWKKIQVPIVVLAAIFAVLVRVVGEEINGAHRWIQVGGFSFQAAELIKLALVLWIAYFLSKRRLEGRIADKNTLQVLGVAIVAVSVVVAGVQSDLGSSAVMLAIIGVTSFIAGLPLRYVGIALAVMLLLGALFIGSSSYRRDRVTTFFNPTADCRVEGYQACQALITIGSGGMFGKGLGKSVQAYGYLPEPANDSIFAIVAEKFGFVGTLAVVGVFAALFMRIAAVAKAAPTDYTRLLVTGVLIWLSIQMMINVGAMVGLLPLKGITLPLVSYGGTSIIFVMIALGIVFQVSRYTDLNAKSHKGSVGQDGYETARYSRRQSL
jgi:cell division protein FtsW